MSELADVVLEDATEKMDKAVSHARAEFATIRTGRASSALVEKLVVEVYGADMKLQDIASFSIDVEAWTRCVDPSSKRWPVNRATAREPTP